MGTQEADWFVATGPSNHGFVSRFEEMNLNHGVNVQGTECGVYGESQDLDQVITSRSGTPDGRLLRLDE